MAYREKKIKSIFDEIFECISNSQFKVGRIQIQRLLSRKEKKKHVNVQNHVNKITPKNIEAILEFYSTSYAQTRIGL